MAYLVYSEKYKAYLGPYGRKDPWPLTEDIGDARKYERKEVADLVVKTLNERDRRGPWQVVEHR